jgi:hypothetical protein
MTDVEREMLIAGGHFKEEVGDKLVPVFTQAMEAVVTKPKEPIAGRAFIPVNIGRLVMGETINRQMRLTTDGREIGVAVELMLGGGRTSQLYLHTDKLRDVTITEALAHLEHTVSVHEGSRQQALALKAGITKLDSVLGSIAARIKDPHPFLETIREAVPDLFRG